MSIRAVSQPMQIPRIPAWWDKFLLSKLEFCNENENYSELASVRKNSLCRSDRRMDGSRADFQQRTGRQSNLQLLRS